jgi:outer membrane lipoprotein-sorting protein
MKKLVLSLTLAASSVPVLAADLFDTVAGRLAATPLVRAEFTQTRHIAALKKPLVIKGHMVLERSSGVIWNIDSPYKMSYAMGSKGVREILPDGSQRVKSARDIPGIGSVEGLFNAILSADRVVLARYFKSQLSGSADNWQLSLAPSAPVLAKALSAVELGGGRNLQSVRIAEASGDETRIQFANIQIKPGLTADEQKLLGAH